MGFILFLQQVSAIGLIGLVLLHAAKADGIGGIGGQANVYGSSNATREMEKGLDQVTLVFAATFILLSIFIAWKL